MGEPRFLAIKNWHKYQGGTMKNRKDEKRTSWVKDYVDKEADPEYLRLTGFHRYILDGCCRLRGRLGQNLPNDPTYISRALGLIPAERSQTPRAVLTLCSLGFLVPTNQQLSLLEEIRGDEIRGEEKSGAETRRPQSEAKAKTPADQKRSVKVEGQPRPTPSENCAQVMLELLSMTAVVENLKAIKLGIEAEASHLGCSIEDAAQSIAQAAMDDRRREIPIDKWYFIDTKWRNRGKPTKANEWARRVEREEELLLASQSRTASA